MAGAPPDTWDGGEGAPKPVPASSSPPAPPAPELPNPRYGAPRPLGEGAMGTVVAKADQALGREIAQKTLKVTRSAGVARFLREARVTAGLEHPGIIPIYDIGRDEDGRWFYTMRLVRGATLEDRLAGCADLTARMALFGHLVDVCQAVAYAHHRGVVHRDIKPANVMVGEFGETVILDWGLAKARGEHHERDDEMSQIGHAPPVARPGETVMGTVLGTPAYMSPEQAQGQVDLLDARSDVWSLGAMLYELLTGSRAFRGDDAWAVVALVRDGRHPSALGVEPLASPELAAVCEKAMSIDRDARYPDAGALADELVRWSTGQRVQAYRYTVRQRLRRVARRYRGVLAVGALAAAFATGEAAFFVRSTVAERDRAVAAERGAVELIGDIYVQRALGMQGTDPWVAERFAAEALTIRENPEARGVLAAIGATPRPQWRWTASLDGSCDDVALADDGSAWCAGPSGVTHLGADGRIVGHDPQPRVALALVGDGTLLSVAPDGAVYHRDRAGEREVTRIPARASLADAVLSVHPSGAWLVGAESAGVWWYPDLVTPVGIEVSRDAAAASAPAIALAPDASRWAVGGADADRIEWVLPDGTSDGALEVRLGGSEAVAFTRDGAHLLVGTSGGEVYRVSPGDGGVTWLERRQSPIVAVADTPWGAVALSEDGAIGGVSPDGAPLRWPGGGGRTIRSDERVLVVGGAGARGLVAWALPEATPAAVGLPAGVSTVLASPDGLGWWITDGDGLFHTVSEASSAVSHVAVAEGTAVRSAVASSGALVALSADGVIRWLGADGALLGTRDLPGAVRLAAGREGPAWATTADGALVQVAPGDAAAPAVAWRVADVALREVDLCPDGSCAAVTTATGEVRVVDLRDGKVLAARSGAARDVAFSPDGRSLLCSDGADAVIWSWREDRVLARLVAHRDAIESVGWSPDGTWLATGSLDRTARVWDADGRLRAVLHGHTHRVASVAFSSKGPALLTGSWDRSVRRWDLSALTADPGAKIVAIRATDGVDLVDGEVVPVAEAAR